MTADKTQAQTQAQTQEEQKSPLFKTTKVEFQSLINGSSITIVDFYADWCGPCKVQKPILEKFALKGTHLRVATVNIEEEPELAADFSVSSIPTLLWFKNGVLLAKETGLRSEDKLRKTLDQLENA